MVDPAAKRKEPLVAVRNIRFNLLRRHSGIESRYHDYRDVNLGKEINWHIRNRGDTHDHNEQAHHQNEKGIFDRKGRH
jgi:hypothetical protein